MERSYVVDQQDIPWTASLPTGIIVLVCVISGGALLLALGCYLAFWVRRRFAGAVSLPIYVVMVVAALLLYAPLPGAIRDILELVASCAYVASAFALRYDMQRYFSLKHGSDLEIGPVLTLLFGAAYINYSLAVVFNGETARDLSQTSIFPPR